jgi:hypothetical protein
VQLLMPVFTKRLKQGRGLQGGVWEGGWRGGLPAANTWSTGSADWGFALTCHAFYILDNSECV